MAWASSGGGTLALVISRVHALALTAFGAVAPACSSNGVVELNWVFVDRAGQPLYPGGQFALNRFEDSCNWRGQYGDETVRYDLRLQLEICDPLCATGCEDPDCLVTAPEPFACTTARASNLNVPAMAEPYQFQARAILELEGGQTCAELPPSCVAVPGPRERLVEPGLVTDLQVYQIAIDLDGTADPSATTARLDLEDCGCEPTP